MDIAASDDSSTTGGSTTSGRVTDVLVIGAGIVGCAIADELSRRGAHVSVFDPGLPGSGASQASAGMLTPHSEGRHDPLMERLGARSLGQWDAFVDRLRADGGSMAYDRSGSLEVALDEHGADSLKEQAALHARAGVVSRWISGPGLRELEPAIVAGARGGLLVPSHGFVGVNGLIDALTRSAGARGGRFTTAPVTGITGHDRLVQVTGPRDPSIAPHVVLAAGCWSGSVVIEGGRSLPVHPVRGQLLHLRPERPSPGRVVWGPRCYTVPWADGTLLVGATTEDVGFDERPTASGVRGLLNAACELLPGVEGATFAGVRVGLRPATPDARPIVGRSSVVPGLIYATGHYRNGVLLAPLTAVVVADLIEGRDVDADVSAVGPQRFGEY
jgi:glycine oxidase